MKFWSFRRKVVFLLISVSLFYSCSEKGNTFGFFPMDDAELDFIQNKYFHPPLFRYYNPPITFEENKAIWFSYNPAKISRDIPYAVSLSRKSLGWIEIDLKEVSLEKNSTYLVNYYKDLEPGEYQITIALNQEKLGSVIFRIKPESNKTSIDYDAPLDESFEELNEDDEENVIEDDILYYSR